MSSSDSAKHTAVPGWLRALKQPSIDGASVSTTHFPYSTWKNILWANKWGNRKLFYYLWSYRKNHSNRNAAVSLLLFQAKGIISFHLLLTCLFVIVQRHDWFPNPIHFGTTNLILITLLKWKKSCRVSVVPIRDIHYPLTGNMHQNTATQLGSLPNMNENQNLPFHRPWFCWWNAVKQIDASISLINDHLTRGETVDIVSIFVNFSANTAFFEHPQDVTSPHPE